MPSILINIGDFGHEDAKLPQYIRVPDGLILLEIQGTINKPDAIPEHYENKDGLFAYDDHELAVKIGRLLEQKDNSPLELLIGQNQKLVGTLKKLDKPLGILKFPKLQESNAYNDSESLDREAVQLVDIVRYKLLFTQQPIPLLGQEDS